MAGIGTGRIVSDYVRPRLEEIDKADVDKRLAFYSGSKQLSPNMWLLQTHKSWAFRGSFTSDVILKRKDKYYITNIPTDKKGQISQINMATRLLDTESGDRGGHIRNVMLDVSINAQNRYDAKDLANTYEWFLYPNETDVKNIDDANSKIVEILGKDKAHARSRILITGGTEAQRRQLAQVITDNFTIREKRIINNCLIEITSANRGYAGCFNGRTDSKGNIIGTPYIIITAPYVNVSDVVIHESVHALRQFDANRDDKLKAVKQYWGRDADLEESLTEAETTGRQKPFDKGKDYQAGYYHYVKVPGKTSGELVTEDRVTITGSTEIGKKGKTVQKLLLLKYPMTNIAHLKLKGNAEAIDTYYKLSEKTPNGSTTTHIQMYKPDATLATDRAQDSQLKQETTGKIQQWDDGKLKNIRGISIKTVPDTSFAKPKHQSLKMRTGKVRRPKERERRDIGRGIYESRGGRRHLR